MPLLQIMQQLHQDPQLIQVFLKGMFKAALLFFSAGVFSGGGGIEGEFPPKFEIPTHT